MMRRGLTLCLFFVCVVCRGQGLIPQPNRVDGRTGNFLVNGFTEIFSPDYPELALYLNDHIERLCGYRLSIGNQFRTMGQISLEKYSDGLPAEGYSLDVTSSRITIRSTDRAGAFYALQTLFQLLPSEVFRVGEVSSAETLSVPCLSIEDYPRFPYRGVMLDVSRTFFDKAVVLQYIDWMARHKLNRLHWHLTDDNGWRIEIKKYPELTEKAAWRGQGEVLPPSYGSGNGRYGGFYTQEDIREIVRYAADRSVEIIPEIDLPGHSQALTSVYPVCLCTPKGSVTYVAEDPHNVLCVGREENYEMLRDILTEVTQLFPSDYIHIGCDEVSLKYWQDCTRCQALLQREKFKTTVDLRHYFVTLMERIVQGLGKQCAAWNEVTAGSLNSGTLVYGWESVEECKRVAETGQPTVMMPASYCYIDMRQHPWDRGHTWAGMVDTRRLYAFEPAEHLSAEALRSVRGVEAAQWAELMDRPDRFLEYQGYPRICALAEVGWTSAQRRNWNDFYSRLTTTHLPRLEAMGIRFRLFLPEVSYQSGVITVTPATASDVICYTSDLSDPDESSSRYTGPIQTTRPELFRFRSFAWGGQSTVLTPTVRLPRVLLAPGEQQTLRVPLNEVVDRDGIWLLSMTQLQDNALISGLEIKGQDTSYVVIKNGQRVNPLTDIRLYIDSMNRSAELIVTLKNNSSRSDELDLHLRPSLYIEPSVRVTSSISCQSKFPITNSAGYRFSSYARSARPCKAGDYILYTFDEPVDCHLIDVRTGLPDVTRFSVTDGTVAYSVDGLNFEGEVSLDPAGCAVIRPHRAVKAVRISIRASNGEPVLCWQSLRVVAKM